MNDKDISFPNFKRDEFEEIIAPSLKQMAALVESALGGGIPGVTADDISSVEIVGGGSRIPKLKEILKEAVGMDLCTTLNANEACAKGCGILGAMLSPKFRVREFAIRDSLPFRWSCSCSIPGRTARRMPRRTAQCRNLRPSRATPRTRASTT